NRSRTARGWPGRRTGGWRSGRPGRAPPATTGRPGPSWTGRTTTPSRSRRRARGGRSGRRGGSRSSRGDGRAARRASAQARPWVHHDLRGVDRPVLALVRGDLERLGDCPDPFEDVRDRRLQPDAAGGDESDRVFEMPLRADVWEEV